MRIYRGCWPSPQDLRHIGCDLIHRGVEALSVQTLMRDLVDAKSIRLAGMMADAKGQEVQSRAAANQNELEDHPKGSSGRRQVDLETLRQFGAVAAFRITRPQQGTRDAACLVVPPRRLGGRSCRWRRPRFVLAESLGVEASRKTRLAGHRLPLAVRRKHVRSMLRQKILPLVIGDVASTRALLNGFPRGVGD